MCALTQSVMKAVVQGVDPAPCLENRGKHSVCTRTREPASVRAPKNRRLYAHQRTGVCTRTKEPASVRAPENRRLYAH